MNRKNRLSAVMALVLVLFVGVSTYAGDIHMPKTEPTPPPSSQPMTTEVTEPSMQSEAEASTSAEMLSLVWSLLQTMAFVV